MDYSFIRSQIRSSIQVKEELLSNDDLVNMIQNACAIVIKAYRAGKKTLLAGNGGSAADAQHIAAEFVNRFNIDRRGLPSIALSTDTSIITSIGNDYGYDLLFSRQLLAYGNEGDIFIGISTSGNSKNIVEALKKCKELGVKTIGFAGANGGRMEEYCDICIKVPSLDTPRIQEAHIMIGHLICYAVEEAIFGGDKPKY